MTLEHDQVREKLIVTALDLMAEGGMEAVKARALAQKVGVSVGSVYNLFGNVEGVLEHACARLFDALNALGRTRLGQIEAQMAAEGIIAAPERLRFVLMSLSALYIDFVTDNEQAWNALLAFNRSRPVGDAADWYLGKQSELIGMLGDALVTAPGMADAERRMTTGWALWAAVHGIVSLSYVGQVRPDTRARTEAQIASLVTPVVAGIFAG